METNNWDYMYIPIEVRKEIDADYYSSLSRTIDELYEILTKFGGLDRIKALDTVHSILVRTPLFKMEFDPVDVAHFIDLKTEKK